LEKQQFINFYRLLKTEVGYLKKRGDFPMNLKLGLPNKLFRS
jgi:hypothetical protein